MENKINNKTQMVDGGYKKSLWRWFIIYVIIGAIIYGGIYYFLSQSGEYGDSQSIAQSPIQQQVLAPTTDTNNIYMSKTDPAKGKYMTDFQGMTLYTFDKDTIGVSNCYKTCSTVWSPYILSTVAQSIFPPNITVVKRIDGSMQFAWNGMPLYYYATDKKIGDITGDGKGGVWHMVKL